MLKLLFSSKPAASERGDTIIEVTFALAILSFVLLGSTAIASTAFRTGQTARERTQISQVAQEQLEAIHSFRDNHTWPEFRNGGAGYRGIESTPKTQCKFDITKQCFSMALSNTGGGTTQWVPVPGSTAASVPTSLTEIYSPTVGTIGGACNYTFELHYAFTPLGNGIPARNQIVTKLANLKYNAGLGVCL